MRSNLTLVCLLNGLLLAGGLASSVSAQGVDQERVVQLRDEGLELSDKGKLLKARAKFKEAIDLDDSHADTWFHYGQTFQRRGKLDEAIKHYTKAISLLSGHHKAFHNRGVALWYQGKLKDALSDVDEAVRLKPRYHEAWNTRASLLTNLGQAREGMEDAGTAIELVEERNDKRKVKRYFVKAYHTRAVAAIRIGELAQAKSDLLFASKRAPGQAAYRFRLAVAQFRLGEHKLAVESCTVALAIKRDTVLASGKRPNPLSSYLRARCVAGRAQARFFLNDKKGALKDLAEAAKLTPDHTYTPLWIHAFGGKAYSLGRLSKHTYKSEEDKWVQQILLLYAGKKSAKELLATAQGADSEAKDARLLQSHCYLALLAERSGDTQKARTHYEKAITHKVLGYTEYWWAKLRLAVLSAK
ncbi:MAG: tetratricopeptide repeat protein [Planctomycetes bacterium]|nr:tetratricopeptide repeat protein [Planctomycetota bacterium]